MGDDEWEKGNIWRGYEKPAEAVIRSARERNERARR